MSTVAIIQARMGSTRLPGKVLMDIGGRSMLERVVHRTRRATLVDDVIVATTTCPADDAIVGLCRSIGVSWFRGNEHDVLDRYHRAAAANRVTTIVRITSDCPLIDPSVIDLVIGEFRAVRPDYASNIFQRSFPRGLDTEVFTGAALATAWREARDTASRVHVTPFIWGHPNRFHIHSVAGSATNADLRWTVDTQLDFDVIRDIYETVDNADLVPWERVLGIVRAEPERLTRNRVIEQKKLEEG